MVELEPKFDREQCLSCAAKPHCNAGRLAEDFAEHTMEAELDNGHVFLNARTIDIIGAIGKNDTSGFQANLEQYNARANSTMERFQLLSRCIDQLLDEGIRAYEQFSTDDVLYNDQLDQIRDRFVDNASIVPVRAPSTEQIRAAIRDTIDFGEMNQCLQDSMRQD